MSNSDTALAHNQVTLFFKWHSNVANNKKDAHKNIDFSCNSSLTKAFKLTGVYTCVILGVDVILEAATHKSISAFFLTVVNKVIKSLIFSEYRTVILRAT